MSNEEIYKNLERKYNKLELIVICLSQVDIHMMLSEEDIKNGNIPSEHIYDSEWWLKKGKELNTSGNEKD